jgi:hypothetical protein
MNTEKYKGKSADWLLERKEAALIEAMRIECTDRGAIDYESVLDLKWEALEIDHILKERETD